MLPAAVCSLAHVLLSRYFIYNIYVQLFYWPQHFVYTANLYLFQSIFCRVLFCLKSFILKQIMTFFLTKVFCVLGQINQIPFQSILSLQGNFTELRYKIFNKHRSTRLRDKTPLQTRRCKIETHFLRVPQNNEAMLLVLPWWSERKVGSSWWWC